MDFFFFLLLTDQVYSTYDINYFEEEKEKDVKRKQFKLTQALAVLAIRQIFKKIYPKSFEKTKFTLNFFISLGQHHFTLYSIQKNFHN